MTDCEDLYNARIRAAIEPDFSTWALAWDVEYTSTNGNEFNVWDIEFKLGDVTDNVIVYTDEYGYVWVVNLTTGATISQTHVDTQPTNAGTTSSILGKYVVYIDEGTGHIIVLKNGTSFADITPSNPLRQVAISPDGKYIYAKYTIYNGGTHHYRALYVGS